MNISTTYEAIVTRKGQITLPAEVRRQLGLKRADRVQVSVHGKTVQLRRQQTSPLEVNFGIARGRRTRLTPQQERAAFLYTVTDNAGYFLSRSSSRRTAAVSDLGLSGFGGRSTPPTLGSARDRR